MSFVAILKPASHDTVERRIVSHPEQAEHPTYKSGGLAVIPTEGGDVRNESLRLVSGDLSVY
jgi:hypothetical protein